jgi:hypothetical protein
VPVPASKPGTGSEWPNGPRGHRRFALAVSFASGIRFALLNASSVFQESTAMATEFKPGDHVEWNSEAGRVRGTIQKKVTREITFKGYRRHASKEEPQYIIKSDKTDHIAIHKGSALKKNRKKSR